MNIGLTDVDLLRADLDDAASLFTIRIVAVTPPSPEPLSVTAAVLATIASALDTGVILIDSDDVLLANEAALALRVVWRAELTSPTLRQLARDARQSGHRLMRDIELPWGASSRAVHVVAAPVPDSTQVALLLTDLQEARRLEAVRRDFVANVSHELKNPVGAILLLAEALRDAAEDSEARTHFTNRLLHEAARMSRLVRELLDLSRIQGGEPLPTLESVAVTDVIADAVEPLRVRADAAGIRLDVGAVDHLVVLGERRQLATALTNLIENAIAYSSRGARVGIGAACRTPEGDSAPQVEISVSDEGVGIAEEDQQRVFERFYRVDAARSRATGGTGLGLAIVKHIMNNHGGRVSVWSRLGVGSTFTLHLPEASRREPEAKVAHSSSRKRDA